VNDTIFTRHFQSRATVAPPRNHYEAIQRGQGRFWEPSRVPTPTSARPGSREKVEELRRRVERGEELWNAADEYRLADAPPTAFLQCS
jgi:hypothetical protein